MSTCSQCGAGRWHPEVARCTRVDCELIAERVEQREQSARDRQPDRLGGEVKRGVVHGGVNG